MEGMRGEESISTLCRREGIAANLYYRWSKDFLEAGKKRLAGDTKREATSTEVVELRKELAQLKELVAEVLLENRVLKKTAVGFDSDLVRTFVRTLVRGQKKSPAEAWLLTR